VRGVNASAFDTRRGASLECRRCCHAC
jgi:hypothetical protein